MRVRTICIPTASAPRPGDLDAVLALWRTAAEGASASDDPAGVAGLPARDPGALLLAERTGPGCGPSGMPVGTVSAGFDGRRCRPYQLAVHPDHRRRGIGSALPAAAEERFERLGGRRLGAMVLQRNPRAHHAWRAAGYAPQEEWRRW